MTPDNTPQFRRAQGPEFIEGQRTDRELSPAFGTFTSPSLSFGASDDFHAVCMKRTLLIVLFGALTSCSTPAAPESAQQPTARQLTGSYYRGDHTGYNVTIDLNDSGNYTATWDGCLGNYGTARGTWSVAGTIITLKPTAETGMMKGHLRHLNLVRKNDTFVFVPDLKDDYYRKYGSDDYSAFHKQKTKPNK